jgi:hypothetical protein
MNRSLSRSPPVITLEGSDSVLRISRISVEVMLRSAVKPTSRSARLTADFACRVTGAASSLPKDIQVIPLCSQKSFIDRAIGIVIIPLRDGVILVIIVLVLFLMNVRTTFITLTVIRRHRPGLRDHWHVNQSFDAEHTHDSSLE